MLFTLSRQDENSGENHPKGKIQQRHLYWWEHRESPLASTRLSKAFVSQIWNQYHYPARKHTTWLNYPRVICVWNCVPSYHLLILEKQGFCSFVNNWTLPCSSISGRTSLSLGSLHYGRRSVTMFKISIQSLSILYEAFLATHCSSDVLQSRRGIFGGEKEKGRNCKGLYSPPTWKDETALESLWHLKNYTVKRIFLAWKAGKRNWAKPCMPCLSTVPPS